jgi:hypothetical protein
MSSTEACECSICCADITAKTGKTTMGCGHSFHFSCLSKWFLSSETCPNCRAEVGENDGFDSTFFTDEDEEEDNDEEDDDEEDEEDEEDEAEELTCEYNCEQMNALILARGGTPFTIDAWIAAGFLPEICFWNADGLNNFLTDAGASPMTNEEWNAEFNKHNPPPTSFTFSSDELDAQIAHYGGQPPNFAQSSEGTRIFYHHDLESFANLCVDQGGRAPTREEWDAYRAKEWDAYLAIVRAQQQVPQSYGGSSAATPATSAKILDMTRDELNSYSRAAGGTEISPTAWTLLASTLKTAGKEQCLNFLQDEFKLVVASLGARILLDEEWEELVSN